jgi:phage baseplate assembly protein W
MKESASGPGFHGCGWGIPVRLDDDRAIALTSTGDEAIRNSIWTILSTSPGERPMRPEFGCAIDDYVFGLIDAGTAGGISRAITEALALWEPRIDVLAVTAVPDPTDSHLLSIEISYQVRSTNSRLNLVYPFYLE